MPDFWVDPVGGSDANDGSFANKWQTLNHAGNHASVNPGDTIHLVAGTYNERVFLNTRSGTVGNPIRVVSEDGPLAAVIDGTYTLPGGAFVGPGTNRVVATDGTFASHAGNFTGLGHVWGALLHLNNVSYWEFDGLRVTNSRGRGVSLEDTVGVKFSNGEVSGVRHTGFWVKGDDTVLEDSEIFDCANFAQVSRGSGVMDWPVITHFFRGRNFTVQRCLIHHNWGEGIGGGATENFFIYDNFIYDNYALNVYMHFTNNCELFRNVIFHTLDNTLGRGARIPGLNVSPPSDDIVANMEASVFTGYPPADFFYMRNNLIITRSSGINLWDNQGSATTSGYIDFINNIVYAYDVDGFAPSRPFESLTNGNKHSNTTIANNMFYHSDGSPAFSGSAITNTNTVTFRKNMWSSAPPGTMQGPGDIIGVPTLVNPLDNIPVGGIPAPEAFKKTANSLGIGGGSATLYPANDFFGVSRGAAPDIGFDQFSAASGGTATTYHVSTSGDNSDGLSEATAWNECDQINWGTVTAGDTITLYAGTFTTQLRPTISGTLTDPIYIRTSGGVVTIQGSRGTTLLPEAGTTGITAETATEHGVWIDQSYIDIDGGDLSGIVIQSWQGHGIFYRKESANCTLKNVEVRNCGWVEESDSWTGGGITYTGPLAAYPNGAGIRLGGPGHKFERVIVHDCGQDAIQSTDGDDNGLGTISFKQCWFHNARKHTLTNNSEPVGGPNSESFNFASHTDVQVYSGGTVTDISFENCVIGPGLTHSLILGQTGTGGSTELITNGDFETGDFTGWDHTDSNGGIKGINVLTPDSSAYSANMQPSNAGDFEFFTTTNFSVTNGVQYTLCFHQNSDLAGASCDVYLHQASGGIGGTNYGINGNNFSTPLSYGWEKHALVFTATATATDARLTFALKNYVPSGKRMRFDNVSIIGAGANNTGVNNLILENCLLYGAQDSIVLGYAGVSQDNWVINRSTFHAVNTKYHVFQMEGSNLSISNSIFHGNDLGIDIAIDNGEPTVNTNNFYYGLTDNDGVGGELETGQQVFASANATDTFAATNDYTPVPEEVVGAGSTPTIHEMFGAAGITGPDAWGSYQFVQSDNLISNWDFENSADYLADWVHYDNGTGGTIEEVSGANSTASAVKITASGSANIQLYQFGVNIIEGQRYQLRVYAYSSSERDIRVSVFGHEAPFANLGINNDVNLSAAWAQHELTFVATGTNDNARLSFQMHQFAQAGDEYYIDEVELVPLDEQIAPTATGRPVEAGMTIGIGIGV
ncbi:MAG: carbohydrate binding domain-containing protein [Chloroflexota bacterium]